MDANVTGSAKQHLCFEMVVQCPKFLQSLWIFVQLGFTSKVERNLSGNIKSQNTPSAEKKTAFLGGWEFLIETIIAFTYVKPGIWSEALGTTKGFINPLELLIGGTDQTIPWDLKVWTWVKKRSFAAAVCSRCDLLRDALCHWKCKDALKLSRIVHSSAY